MKTTVFFIETITLCPDGNHYEGRFTLIATNP